MLTRCPSCATTFRITPEQLKARQGRVRCGQCQHVFNALETLVEEPAPAAPPAPAQMPQAAASAPSPVPEPVPATDTTEPAAEATEPPAAEPPRHDETPEKAVTPAAIIDPQAPLGFDSLPPPAPPRRAWPWVIGVLLAGAVLALQVAHHYRAELAVVAPALKPALQALCDVARCDLPLPRHADLVAIEASDLHPDPANAARLQLVATLKNRAPHVQQYPHLELTLTDTADKALLRRALAPADYLPKDLPAAAGFAAAGELAVALTLDVKDLAPVGYRLYVFYP